MKYHLEQDPKTKRCTLEKISDGRKIENLVPYEAYQIMYSDEIPLKVAEFLKRINKMDDNVQMFGSDIKDMIAEAFQEILTPAVNNISELEETGEINNEDFLRIMFGNLDSIPDNNGD